MRHILPRLPFLLIPSFMLLGGCRLVLDIPDGPAHVCNPDGVLEPGETCDGTALGDATCPDFGHSGGWLVCREDCTLDTSGCGGTCGDGTIEPAFEDCEGWDLDGGTCESVGHHPGVLTCSDACRFDTIGCGGFCGDGLLQIDHETCDGLELGALTCRDGVRFFGEPACGADCRVDAASCRDTELWGTPGLEIGGAVTVTPDGAVLVTGPTNGPMDGQTTFGGTDLFLSRYDPDGRRAWSRVWGSPANDIGSGVRTDAAGNIFVSGAVTDALPGQVSQGGEDLILTRFDAAGVHQWSRQWGSPANDQAAGCALDATGHVYITGYAGGPVLGQVHAGGDDAVLLKVSPDGEVVWARQWGTGGTDTGYAVTVAPSGELYVAGRTSGALDGQTNTGEYDAFLTKFDADGTKLWTRLWGSIEDERAQGVTTDTDGNIYIAGFTSGSLDGLPISGGDDATLTKFEPGGMRLWSRQWGSPAEDRGYGVAVDGAGHVCVAGHTRGDLDDQPYAGSDDVFLTCYQTDGTKLWSRQWGTGLLDRALALTMDFAGNLFLTGYTESGLNGQPAVGLYDVFLLFVAGF